MVYLLLALYFFSGLAALAYEILWARMLSTLFGVSIFGVVITVAAFMAGLGAGSLLGKRYLLALKRPLLFFGGVELAIAIFSLWLPKFIFSFDTFLITQAPTVDIAMWYGIQGIAVFLLMFFPAMLLGAVFPVMVRLFSERGVPLSVVYGLNTLGGVLGALLPLLLLPLFGWHVSLRLVAIMGVIIGLVALVLVKWLSTTAGQGAESVVLPNEKALQTHMPASFGLSMLAYGGIGAAALMLQVAWIRLFGMVMLRTEYVLAVIVATFLIGIALGSLLATRLHRAAWFTYLPLIAATSCLATLWFFPALAGWVEQMRFASLAEAMLTQSALIALLTLPATLAFGAWLPYLVTQFGGGGKVGGWFYGANSIGACVGALAAGFILIPLFGSPAVICLAVLLILLASMVWVRHLNYMLGCFVLVLLVMPVWNLPDVHDMLPVAQSGAKDLFLKEDAVSVTHVVQQVDGQRVLMADLQRLDASTELTAIEVQKNQARLPLLLNPSSVSLLFLGLGTGITVAGSLPYYGLTRTAVELSEGAIEAAQRWFQDFNGDVLEHTKIVHDDARRFLKTDTQHYDLIIGDLFHPDFVGRSALLSLEQFQRAKARLSDGGIFVQWIAINQFDLASLKVVFRTFRSVFEKSYLFMDGFRIALVGPENALSDVDSLLNQLKTVDVDLVEATGGEGVWTWYGRYWGALALDAGPLQSEWSPVIEYGLPAAKYKNKLNLTDVLAYLLFNRPTASLAAQQLGVNKASYEQFEAAYMASEMLVRSWLAGFAGRAMEAQQLLRLAHSANAQDRWVGFDMADKMFSSVQEAVNKGVDEVEALHGILAIREDHVPTLKALWRKALEAGQTDQANDYHRKLKQLVPLDVEI